MKKSGGVIGRANIGSRYRISIGGTSSKWDAEHKTTSIRATERCWLFWLGEGLGQAAEWRKNPLINSAHGAQEIMLRVTLILLTLRCVAGESECERFIRAIKSHSTMKEVSQRETFGHRVITLVEFSNFTIESLEKFFSDWIERMGKGSEEQQPTSLARSRARGWSRVHQNAAGSRLEYSSLI